MITKDTYGTQSAVLGSFILAVLAKHLIALCEVCDVLL